jgi:hypothetical protein
LIEVAGEAVRVQKPRGVPGPQVGESCHLVFAQPRWYESDERGSGGRAEVLQAPAITGWGTASG